MTTTPTRKQSNGLSWRWIGVLLTAMVACILSVFGVGWLWLTKDLPSVKELVHQRQQRIMNGQQSTQVYARDKKTVILHNGRFVVEPVKLEAVAPVFVQALVATEDRRFYMHKGVDPLSIFRALVSNVRGHGVKEGGSTLTQQLTRALFLSNERSLQRKLKEIILAYQIEQALSKQEILELYMNHVYFGQGAYGISAAANVFFSKDPKSLTVTEAALLAGLPQAPSNYNPLVNPDLAKARRNEVLQNLAEVATLTRDEARTLSEKKLGLKPNLDRLSLQNKSPYFNAAVQQQVMDLFGLNEQEFWQSNFKIYTTLDVASAKAAHLAIQTHAAKNKRTGLKQQAMLLAMNRETGAVLAYEGGKDFNESQFDRIKQSPRSPGSTFKIFTYTEALRQGYSPYQVVVDEPVQLGSWKPENYDKKHYGAMTLQEAFNRSNNIVAVKLMEAVGAQSVVDLAHKLGINSPLEANLTTTLGGSSVLMQEMVQAVGAIANHGQRVTPYMVDKIVDAEGHVIFKHTPEVIPVLEAPVADAAVRLMQGVVQSGTGRAANYGELVAGKTGTSDGFRDAWFMGFNPTIVAGVWVGNDDNTPMNQSISGGGMPTQIWHDFMMVASKSLPAKGFTSTPLAAKSPPPSSLGDSTQETSPIDEETSIESPSGSETPSESPSDANGVPLLQEPPPPPPRRVDAWSVDGNTAPPAPASSPTTGTRLRQALNRAKERVASEFSNGPSPAPGNTAPLPEEDDDE